MTGDLGQGGASRRTCLPEPHPPLLALSQSSRPGCLRLAPQSWEDLARDRRCRRTLGIGLSPLGRSWLRPLIAGPHLAQGCLTHPLAVQAGGKPHPTVLSGHSPSQAWALVPPHTVIRSHSQLPDSIEDMAVTQTEHTEIAVPGQPENGHPDATVTGPRSGAGDRWTVQMDEWTDGQTRSDGWMG